MSNYKKINLIYQIHKYISVKVEECGHVRLNIKLFEHEYEKLKRTFNVEYLDNNDYIFKKIN